MNDTSQHAVLAAACLTIALTVLTAIQSMTVATFEKANEAMQVVNACETPADKEGENP